MSYSAAVERLYALGHELAPPVPDAAGDRAPAPRRKFDLAHMRTLAQALGDPQLRFPSVLIAGTNGKGSTAATLSSILTAAGYRTALYTSPHLYRVNERIQVDHTPISDDDFARLYFQVDSAATGLVSQGKLPHPPSFFEVLTALAFLYFAQPAPAPKVDIAILEVGLGGRLDATNIVDPILAIITDIALDHQDYLGPTLTDIAREKCGILRPHATLITLPQHPEANQVIGDVATALQVLAINAADFIPTPNAFVPNPRTAGEPNPPDNVAGPQHPQSAAPSPPASLPPNRYVLTLDNQPLQVDSPLPGQHQQRNIALAIAAAAHLRNDNSYIAVPNTDASNKSSYIITNAQIEQGIRDTRWPGRLELLPNPQGPSLLLDVAHNPAGAWTLRAAIAQLPSSQPRTLIFSCLADKDLTEVSRILFPLFDNTSGDPDRVSDHIILAPINNPRASSVEDLLAAAHALSIPTHAAPHILAALTQARQITPPHGLIIATGSVYLVGELRHLALGEPA